MEKIVFCEMLNDFATRWKKPECKMEKRRDNGFRKNENSKGMEMIVKSDIISNYYVYCLMQQMMVEFLGNIPVILLSFEIG